MQPLVTVICLCYNQARFVQEAIASVVGQTYPRIEIIIVDDASTDGSAAVIDAICAANPALHFLPLKTNHGNCAAFNKALAASRGEFVIDMACDDVMTPERIEKQVTFFRQLDDSYGVVFSDAIYIDERGQPLYNHTAYLQRHSLIDEVPTGDVYVQVLSVYFICSPTMMMRRSVLSEMNGYDPSLAYEDFDFWVRSSRNYRYGYQAEPLMKVRRSANSMSTRLYKPGDRQLHSTYLVCKKARLLNRTPAEHAALVNRVRYELRQAVFSDNRHEAALFFSLLETLDTPHSIDRVLIGLSRLQLRLAGMRRLYHRLRF